MDPNANLLAQERILSNPKRGNDEYRILRELRYALDIWLNRGGVDPVWSDCPLAARYFGR